MISPPIPLEALDATTETYRLELSLGTDDAEALRKAFTSGYATMANSLRAEIAETASRMAEELDSSDDDDMATDGPAALLWLARLLMDTLPPDGREYQPTEQDLIEVILYGTVVVGEPGSGNWALITTDMTNLLEFDRHTSHTAQVRLIRRDSNE